MEYEVEKHTAGAVARLCVGGEGKLLAVGVGMLYSGGIYGIGHVEFEVGHPFFHFHGRLAEDDSLGGGILIDDGEEIVGAWGQRYAVFGVGKGFPFIATVLLNVDRHG